MQPLLNLTRANMGVASHRMSLQDAVLSDTHWLSCKGARWILTTKLLRAMSERQPDRVDITITRRHMLLCTSRASATLVSLLPFAAATDSTRLFFPPPHAAPASCANRDTCTIRAHI